MTRRPGGLSSQTNSQEDQERVGSGIAAIQPEEQGLALKPVEHADCDVMEGDGDDQPVSEGHMKYPIVLTTSGEYSDYKVLGIFEWLAPQTPAEALETFLTEFPEQREAHYFDDDAFVGWLNRGRYIRDVDFVEMHIGSYGRPPTELEFTPR